jgi:hypothetical protein
VADTAGAHWLLDEIALAQRHIIPVKREDFQVWDLKVNADQPSRLSMMWTLRYPYRTRVRTISCIR